MYVWNVHVNAKAVDTFVSHVYCLRGGVALYYTIAVGSGDEDRDQHLHLQQPLCI